MRAKCELCVKVVGLVLCCSGVVTMLFGAPFLLHRPAMESLYPADVVQGLLGDELRSRMQAATSTQARRTAIHLLLCGTIPTALGLYLMRFGGAVARFCYPEPDSIVAARATAEGLDLKLKTDSQRSEPLQMKDGQKYAPPGYFKPEA